MDPGATTSVLFAFVVVQGHRLLPLRGRSPVRQILGLLLVLSPWPLRVPVMRVRVRLPRARAEPSQVRILG